MFGGRDEASLDIRKVGEEEKGGHGIPRGDLHEEESSYTRDELTREKDTRTHGLIREEDIRVNRDKDTYTHAPTREEEIAVEANI